MVKRYDMEIISEAHIGGKYLDVSEPYIEEEESPDGEWVNYSDYKKLLDDVKELYTLWNTSDGIFHTLDMNTNPNRLTKKFEDILAKTRTTSDNEISESPASVNGRAVEKEE